MFQEKLKALRTQRGMSQEELARELHVVRQTVSKWERGASVPDGDMLKAIAALFGVTVGELLGEPESADVQAIALELALLNRRLEARERRGKALLKALAIIAGVVLAVWLVLMYGSRVNLPAVRPYKTFHMTCTLEGRECDVTVSLRSDGSIYSYGGDTWIYETLISKLDTQDMDGRTLMEAIAAAVTDRGGSVNWEVADDGQQPKKQYPIYAGE